MRRSAGDASTLRVHLYFNECGCGRAEFDTHSPQSNGNPEASVELARKNTIAELASKHTRGPCRPRHRIRRCRNSPNQMPGAAAPSPLSAVAAALLDDRNVPDAPPRAVERAAAPHAPRAFDAGADVSPASPPASEWLRLVAQAGEWVPGRAHEGGRGGTGNRRCAAARRAPPVPTAPPSTVGGRDAVHTTQLMPSYNAQQELMPGGDPRA